jgi:DNA-binding NtrC family response regulator
MVCGGEEADQVRRQLWDQKTGFLITYRRVEDMMLNCPTGHVAMVILAEEDDSANTQRTLNWLRYRWPGCPMIVVGGTGDTEHEMAARQGGAFYLAPGEAQEQLGDMVSHALRALPATRQVFSP